MQEELVAAEPDRFFVPAYVGHKGWVGARLDVQQDWDELAGLITDSCGGRCRSGWSPGTTPARRSPPGRAACL